MHHVLRRLAGVCALALTAALASAPAHASTRVGGGVVGTAGYYDYAPTVIQSGQVQDFWWCGDLPGHVTDTILHEQYSFTGGLHVTIPEHAVLTEGAAGTWDDALVCNPDVIEGSFVDPLGDGVTYTYEMFYVAYGNSGSADNQIGAAFSLDGDRWVKYPQPVVTAPYSNGAYYGAGQPNALAAAGGVTLLYEWQEGSLSSSHIEATSVDGIHFTTAGTLTTAGLPTGVTWGAAAYDTQDGRWYAAYNDDPTRAAATTGGVVERGQPGVTLYATSDLLAGTWSELDTIDTNLTGWESNFLAGLLRDPAGTLYTPLLPTVELYASTSIPGPAANASPAQRGASGGFNQWDIAWSTWTPGSPARALSRYYSGSLHVHEVSTGWVDTGSFGLESVLAHVYEAPTGVFTKPLYGCVAGNDDYFVSQGSACEGQFALGLEGYVSPASGSGLVALYRCYTGADHFVSLSATCEGRTVEGLLGWATA
jgi:hypothetical protein